MITLKRPDGNLPEDFHLSRRGVAGAIFAGYARRRPSRPTPTRSTPTTPGWSPRR